MLVVGVGGGGAMFKLRFDWHITSPEQLFFFRVYIQDLDIISFEMKAIKISGNKTEWTGKWAKIPIAVP